MRNLGLKLAGSAAVIAVILAVKLWPDHRQDERDRIESAVETSLTHLDSYTATRKIRPEVLQRILSYSALYDEQPSLISDMKSRVKDETMFIVSASSVSVELVGYSDESRTRTLTVLLDTLDKQPTKDQVERWAKLLVYSVCELARYGEFKSYDQFELLVIERHSVRRSDQEIELARYKKPLDFLRRIRPVGRPG